MNSKLKIYADRLFLIAILSSPVIFFTNLTRNPYLIQERILQVLLALSILLLSISIYRKKEIVIPRTFLDRPIWIFFTIAVLSIIISLINYQEYRWAISGYSGRRILMFLFSGIIPFYFASSLNDKYFKKLQYAVILAGSIASLYAVLQFLHLDFIWPRVIDPYGQRSISTFGNPNFLSAYLLIVIFWIIGNLFLFKKSSGVWLSLLLLNLAGLGITMTRSTFMGLFIGVIILIYFLVYKFESKFKQLKKTIYYILVGIFALIVIFSVISPQFLKRIKSVVSIKGMGPALYQRLLIWESSYNMFIDTPVIGRGWGNFEIFYPFYQGKIVRKETYKNLRTHANNAHNILMELLTGVGIIGTGVYLWLMAVFVYMSRKIYLRVNKKQKIWVLVFSIAGISFWLDNILNVSLFFPVPALTFWLNAGLLASIGRESCKSPELKIDIKKFYGLFIILVIVLTSGVIYFNYKYFVSSTHFFKGFKYSRQKQFERARNELLKCYEIYSLNVDNNYELGNIYARLKNLDKSIQAYHNAIRANPGYDEIYFNLGVMYIKKGDMEKAETHLKKSIAMNPLSIDTYRSLGDIKGQQKKFKEAMKLYKEALELKSDDETLLNNYGYYNEVTGNFKEALQNYLSALRINPEFKPAALNIRRANAKYNKTRPVKKINQLFRKTDMFIKDKNWQRALELTNEVILIDPVNLRAFLYAGNLYFKIGKTDKAVEFYNIILSIDPDNTTARSNLNVIDKIGIRE